MSYATNQALHPPAARPARTPSRLAVLGPDAAVAAVALPVFVIAGWPLAGWAAAVGVWIAQRLAQGLIERRVAASDDPRTIVGLAAGSMIARGWLVAITVFLVGLADRRAGLAAALLVISLFTVYLATRLISRPPAPRGTRP